MKEAILYEKLDNDYVKCHLCAHRCKIAPSRLGAVRGSGKSEVGRSTHWYTERR